MCRRCAAVNAASAVGREKPTDGPLLDTFGRVATDLRVSLTDRCNLRCRYCMPAEGLDWLPGDAIAATRRARPADTHRGQPTRHHHVRFTGGEPLLRRATSKRWSRRRPAYSRARRSR